MALVERYRVGHIFPVGETTTVSSSFEKRTDLALGCAPSHDAWRLSLARVINTLRIFAPWNSAAKFSVVSCTAVGATTTKLLADEDAILSRDAGPSAPLLATVGGGPKLSRGAVATGEEPTGQTGTCNPGGGAPGAVDAFRSHVS